MRLKHIVLSFITLFILSGCGNNSSSSTSVPQTKTGSIDLYCINDYHGQISKENHSYYYEGGIARFGTYLNKKTAENPTGSIFLNAGDLWQDTFDSAKNKGELMMKSMVELNCEAMALGNHEFDWGQETIKENRKIAENENNITKCNFLGANIYHYEDGQAKDHADELCSSYKIVERQGFKIGIIGAIGEKQLTSITSSIVENITFLNPIPIVKQISDDLKTNHGCELVIYLFHGSSDQVGYKELSAISSTSGKHYVDAGFLGHTHQFESVFYNGVPWIQSYQHGAVLGHVNLKIAETSPQSGVFNSSCYYYPDYSSKDNYKGREENGYGFGSDSIYAQDELASIKMMVDQYLTPEFISDKKRNVATLINHNNYVGEEIGNILAKATSEYINKITDPVIPKIDVVINNGNRDTIELQSSGKLTNEELFNLCPFTNKTIIASVLGKDIYSECVRFGSPYYLPGEASITINKNKYYNVACIDYLLLHKNVNRQYDYFSSYSGAIYTIDAYSHDILLDYFADNNSFDMESLSSVAYTGLN